MFDVPSVPGAPSAAPPSMVMDMSQAGAGNAMVPVPQGQATAEPFRKKGILAAVLCAAVGAGIGVFVTKAWISSHGKKK